MLHDSFSGSQEHFKETIRSEDLHVFSKILNRAAYLMFLFKPDLMCEPSPECITISDNKVIFPEYDPYNGTRIVRNWSFPLDLCMGDLDSSISKILEWRLQVENMILIEENLKRKNQEEQKEKEEIAILKKLIEKYGVPDERK